MIGKGSTGNVYIGMHITIFRQEHGKQLKSCSKNNQDELNNRRGPKLFA
jgi:hypothetical protein